MADAPETPGGRSDARGGAVPSRRRRSFAAPAGWALVVLGLATLALWVRSLWTTDQYVYSPDQRGDPSTGVVPTAGVWHYLAGYSYRGKLYFVFRTAACETPGGSTEWQGYQKGNHTPKIVAWLYRDHLYAELRHPHAAGFGWWLGRFQIIGSVFDQGHYVLTTGRDLGLLVPHWSVLLVSTALGVPLLRRSRRQRSRRRGGICPACGYDVRATPARCPECGRSSNGAKA